MSGRTKLGYAAISILMACLLWIYVVGVEKPTKNETISGIVVTLQGEDELLSDYSLVVTSNKKMTIDLEVQGSIVDVASLRNMRDEISVTADLSIVTTAGTHQLMYEVTLPEKLSDKITVVGGSPAYISVKIEKVQTTPVEVRLRNEVSIADGYIAEQPAVNPDTILVTGPEATVARIAYAEAVLERENVSSSITTEVEYKLYDEYGQEIPRTDITADNEYVTVSMEVVQIKEIPLSVELLPGGGATVNDATVDIEPSSITVKGDADILAALNVIQLDPIDLAEQASRTGRYTRTIVLPNDVVNISGVTECTVTVEIAGLVTQVFACDNITVMLPEGYVYELTTTQLSIAVRGPAEAIEEVRANNLRAVVTLEEEDIARGAVSAEAVVYVDGHSEVGVVGNYRVALVIMTEEEAAAQSAGADG